MLKAQQCCLCSQIEGRQSNDLIARMLPDQPYIRRVMLESPSFAVIPSLGPLVLGHSLLCPKYHVRSFAAVPGDLHAEFREISACLRRALSEKYGNSIYLFEHGMAAAGGRILCTVDHAHLHFLPLPRSFDGEVAADQRWTEFDGSPASLQQIAGDREYIFYETPDGVCRLLTGELTLESQYMRKLIAEGLGRAAHWNWRETPDPQTADETWRHFALLPETSGE